ncbi:MAG: DUF58 domain-containing protein [Aquificaceae bacterium]
MKTRYKVRVNRAGLIFIGITIFLGVAAVNTANNLLYLVVSYMLSFMLLSGMLSLYNLRGLEVVLIPPEEVYAGLEASFRIILKNKKRLPSFLIEVKRDEGQSFFPIIRKSLENSILLSFEKRGFYKEIELEVSSSFPVGLFERFFSLKVPLNLVVFPRPSSCDKDRLLYKGKDRDYAPTSSKEKGYEEVQGIKEYTNEPMKLVHWKLSAKTGNIYVKDMVEEKAPPIVLSLDMVEGSLEERLSKLSCLIIKFLSEGRAVGLKLPHQTIEPSTGTMHKRVLLRELALL